MRPVLVLLLFAVLAHSQETRAISCRLLGFQSGDAPVSLIAAADKNEIICEFETSRISKAYRLTAVNGVLNFLDSDSRKLACSVRVPNGAQQLLIVFLPNMKDSSGPWRGFTIKDSKSHFPDGGALVVNLYQHNIRFVIGEHKYMIKPGDQHGISMPHQRDDFNMATVAFEFSHEGKWAKASESRQRFTEGLRYLVLAYTDPYSHRPRLSTYQDLPFQNALHAASP
jgi:hypothetical protein